MQFGFLEVLIFIVFKLVVVLLLVVGGSETYLPTPPSWPEASLLVMGVCDTMLSLGLSSMFLLSPSEISKCLLDNSIFAHISPHFTVYIPFLFLQHPYLTSFFFC